MRTTAAAGLVSALEKAQIPNLFTLSGNQILSVYDACLDSNIRLIHVRHEGAAAYMADAWGRLTGQPGVALVTAGPGHLNALTPLYVASAAQSPMVLLSGHCAKKEVGHKAFQELDQVAAAAPVAKAAWLVHSPEKMEREVCRALRIAESFPPGPVHVSLPSDVLESQVDEGSAEDIESPNSCCAGASAESIEAVLDTLARAESPLLLVGPAMARLHRWKNVEAFARTVHVPVLPMESPRGTKDPALGKVAALFPQADTVLLLGKEFDFMLRAAGRPLFSADCSVVQITPGHPGDAPITLHIPEDPSSLTPMLIERAGLRSWPDRSAWVSKVEAARRQGREGWGPLERSPHTPIHPLRLLKELRPFFHDNTIFISDGGEFGQWAQAALTAKSRVINGPSGVVGCSIPFALSAKLAFPEALVVALVGDGAFGFHAMEFDTALRYNLPVVVVVGNDAGWNAEKQIQIRRYGADRLIGCDLLPTRYDELVKALGGYGEYVDRPDEIGPSVDRAIRSGRPACVNVNIQAVPAP
jgi:acetolactate synthase-1/2/3 large subunit